MSKATCSVDDCDRAHYGRSYCKMHLYRLRVNGDPLVTRKPGSPAGETNPMWRGDDVAYPAVHRRLRVLRGRAVEHDCINCGGGAQDWAYQHTAEDERICATVGLPYTTDLSHYQPMCSPCHTQMDALYGWTHPKRQGRGVSRVKKTGRWRAYATLDGKQRYGGSFVTREEAERAAHDLRLRLLDELEARPA